MTRKCFGLALAVLVVMTRSSNPHSRWLLGQVVPATYRARSAAYDPGAWIADAALAPYSLSSLSISGSHRSRLQKVNLRDCCSLLCAVFCTCRSELTFHTEMTYNQRITMHDTTRWRPSVCTIRRPQHRFSLRCPKHTHLSHHAHLHRTGWQQLRRGSFSVGLRIGPRSVESIRLDSMPGHTTTFTRSQHTLAVHCSEAREC